MRNLESDMMVRAMLRAAREAGGELLRRQDRAEKTEISARDFITDADHASDAIIREILKERFPEIPYASEETGEPAEGASGWCVDPLDGTVNFFHKDVFWGISIARLVDGIPEEGVVCLPALRSLFFASESRRWAYMMNWTMSRRKKIYVSKHADLKSALVWTDHNKPDPPLTKKVFERLDEITLLPQIRVCCTASMMWLATGKVAGYIHPGPTPSDTAAAILIVRKAGGIVTDKYKIAATPFSRPVIATNLAIYEELEMKIRHLFL